MGLTHQHVLSYNPEFTITLLTASNGTSSMHAESGDTESSGGSGSIVIKYDVSI